jgi:hypothetical protein
VVEELGQTATSFVVDVGEEQPQLVARVTRVGRQHLAAHHNGLDIDRMGVAVLALLDRQDQPDGEPGHLGKIGIGGTVETAHGEVLGYHAGDDAPLLGAGLGGQTGREARVGSAFFALAGRHGTLLGGSVTENRRIGPWIGQGGA